MQAGLSLNAGIQVACGQGVDILVGCIELAQAHGTTLRERMIVGGKGVNDGIVQYWFDGRPVIDRHDVLLRTGANPTMQFNQLVIAPYIGDGSPVAQSMWIDDLTVATGRAVGAR